MARITRLKNPPTPVKEYTNLHSRRMKQVQDGGDFTYDFYKYRTVKGEEIYGIEISRNGRFWDNSNQRTLDSYKQENKRLRKVIAMDQDRVFIGR